jgi:hypothetical protein
MAHQQRHPECVQCVFFKRTRLSSYCLPCGAGENFLEKIIIREPTDQELMEIYAKMDEDNDDNRE